MNVARGENVSTSAQETSLSEENLFRDAGAIQDVCNAIGNHLMTRANGTYVGSYTCTTCHFAAMQEGQKKRNVLPHYYALWPSRSKLGQAIRVRRRKATKQWPTDVDVPWCSRSVSLALTNFCGSVQVADGEAAREEGGGKVGERDKNMRGICTEGKRARKMARSGGERESYGGIEFYVDCLSARGYRPLGLLEQARPL
jgi:hypothetical protein